MAPLEANRICALGIFLLLTALTLSLTPARAQEDEIVANLAGGRVLIHVTGDSILFAAIDHPLEAKSVPPRVVSLGSSHIGILFGASEWQSPAEPRPIRLDRDIPDVRPNTKRQYQQPAGSGETDLEEIGVVFLEKLRPLVSQLHHKIDLKPDEPLFEIVLIGYAPQAYGPEVWAIDYQVEQESIGGKSDFWQTHILRPRFTQLYPPEKHQAKALLELRFPADLQDIPLTGLIQQNDPQIARLRSSDARFAKVIEQIEHGQPNKSNPQDAADFLRAALPVLAGNARFIEGQIGESSGFEWIVPPEERVDKQQRAEDKDHPPDAPTLRRKPNP
jgi:hypothetical protein